MTHKIKMKIFGLSLTAFLIITSSIFMYFLIDTKILTWQLLVICAIAFLALSAGVLALSWDIRKRARSIVAAVLALIILIVQIIGSYYILVGRSALEKITDSEQEHTEIGVYVRNDDSAKNIEDTKGYTFGILEIQDRALTDFAIEDISQKLENSIITKNCSGIEELMNSLLYNKEIDAIIVNKSFLDLLEEIEGHTEDKSKIREIYTVSSKTEIVPNQIKPVNENIFTVYISGIDCYGSLSRRSRSDVNILATINAETGQILLVSTPRDYYVPLSISNGVPDKLTHAGIYGIEVSKNTVGMLYETDIDYYFRVNFDGFRDIIDALGGITVVSDYKFSSGGYNFVVGENFINGEQALSFARNRYALPSGDRQRGKNQMAVIKAVIDKATGPAIIMNYKSTLDGLAGAFETNMPYEKITKLIQNQIKNGTKWNVVSYSVDGTGTSRKPYSLSSKAYVMIPDYTTVDRAKELMDKVKNGEIVEQ